MRETVTLRFTCDSMNLTTKITAAIEKLEAALNSAMSSAGVSLLHDEQLSARIDSYREVARRQRLLAGDLEKAMARRDLPEVARLGKLIERSSVLMKMDLEHIVSSIKVLKEGELRSAA